MLLFCLPVSRADIAMSPKLRRKATSLRKATKNAEHSSYRNMEPQPNPAFHSNTLPITLQVSLPQTLPPSPSPLGLTHPTACSSCLRGQGSCRREAHETLLSPLAQISMQRNGCSAILSSLARTLTARVAPIPKLETTL